MEKITYRVNCAKLSLSEVNDAMSIAANMVNPETKFIFYAEPNVTVSARLSRDFSCFNLAEIPHLNNLSVSQLRMMYKSIEAAQKVIENGLLEDTSTVVETPTLVVTPSENDTPADIKLVTSKKRKSKKESELVSSLTEGEQLIYNSMVVEETVTIDDNESITEAKDSIVTIEVGVDGDEPLFAVKN
jgi:hypothetical protein